MTPTSVTQDQFFTTLRYIITTGGGFLAGKGYISGDTLAAILTLTMMVAPWVWGLYTNWAKQRQSDAAVVNNTIHAALTGEVSQAVIEKASPEQALAIEASPNAKVAGT